MRTCVRFGLQGVCALRLRCKYISLAVVMPFLAARAAMPGAPDEAEPEGPVRKGPLQFLNSIWEAWGRDEEREARWDRIDSRLASANAAVKQLHLRASLKYDELNKQLAELNAAAEAGPSTNGSSTGKSPPPTP